MTTFSTHTYAAQTDTAEVLSLRSGEVSLDAGRIPHVESELTLAVEDVALLNSLDPRAGRRVQITAAGEFANASRTRVFDLGIRSTTPDRAAGTVTLRLASDEALLSDFAQLADDRAPRGLEGSLRDVCGYVLGKIGAYLEPGDPDADVTAYWPLTNLMTNPSVANTAVGYSAGTNSGEAKISSSYAFIGSTSVQWSSAAAGDSVLHCRSFPVEAGKQYVMSAHITTTAGRTVRMLARFRDPDGTILTDVYGDPVAAVGTPTFVPVSHIVTAPEGASSLSYNLVHATTAGNQSCFGDAFMFYEGDELVPYFDGSTASAGYTTVWNETSHASSSTRTPILERDPASTIWPAGRSGMDFLHPLLSAAGLRLVCDEQRRWTLRGADFRAAGTQTHRYGINIESAEEQLSREDDAWFDAAVYVYRWTPADGREQERIDAFALNDPPTKVLRVELNDTPFPGPGRAESIVRRAQGKGRTVTITRIPTWLEHTDQELQITLDGTPIQTGTAGSIRYDFDTDTVAVTSRTTDTPPNAISLFPTGVKIADLTGVIADLDVGDY